MASPFSRAPQASGRAALGHEPDPADEVVERHRPGARRPAGLGPNTQGEMPSRRQAMARLLERWQELRRVSAAHRPGS